MRIGPHRLTQGSLTGIGLRNLLEPRPGHPMPVRVLYSDPPWGDGNLKYWQTMNRKMTGEDAPQVTHDELYARLREIIAVNVRGYVFIETGLRWIEYVQGQLTMAGVGHLCVQRLVYNRTLENALVFGSTSPGLTEHLKIRVAGMTGPAVARDCVAAVARPGEVVLDPCCGMGYTARAAVAAGMTFYGNELNAKRLAKTAAYLESTRAAA